MLPGIQASLSAIKAFGQKLSSTASNAANINSDGYKKTRVTMESRQPEGVKARTEQVDSPGPVTMEPTANGLSEIEKSNVDVTEIMTDLLTTRRYFEANIKAVQASDQMIGTILDKKG